MSLVVSCSQPGESLSPFESKITLPCSFSIITVACFLPSQTAQACCIVAVFVYSVYFPYLIIQVYYLLTLTVMQESRGFLKILNLPEL